MGASTIKKIYIIRHGQTDYNLRGIVQGSGIDSDINDLGKSQAKAFFNFYQHINFDKIYSSKLKRTHQSIEGFIQKNIGWQQHEGLNEISWGTREGKRPNYSDNLIFSKIIKLWRKGETDLSFEGGESPNIVAERQNIFLDLIKNQKNENTILVAMHGRALRILLANILNNNLSEMDNYGHTNLCLYIIHYHYDTNTFTLELANDTTHLEALNFAQ